MIERAKLGLDGSAGSGLDVEEEGELRRSASRALVGMTELYLTDLWSVFFWPAPLSRGVWVLGQRMIADDGVYAFVQL